MSIRTTKMRPPKGSAIIPPGTANGKRKFMKRQCLFQKGGGGRPARPLSPAWTWSPRPPYQDLPGSQSSAGLAWPCPGAAGRPCGPRHGGRDQGRVGEWPGGRRATIYSSAPSVEGCREKRELAAPPVRAEPRPLRALTVGLPTGSGEAGRAVLAASDFLSEKYTEQRVHSCAPAAQK